MKQATFLFSLIAFAFSIMAFFNIQGRCTPDAILSLIAICTTLIVGVSVVDVVRVQKLEKDMERVRNLEKTLDNTKSELERIRQHTNIALSANWGLTLCATNPKKAIEQVWKAVEKSLKLEDANRTNTCIGIAEVLVKNIKNDKQLTEKLKNGCRKESPVIISDEVELTKIYKVFEEKISNVINEINGLCGVDN